MKDYYAILHVLPTAEIDVIQAAFRALSRKYHPDTCTGDKASAGKRMQDINEAYGVLGDVKKRAEYDAKRKADNQEDDFANNAEDIDSRLEEDWKIACKYCPEAAKGFEHLNKLSRSLAFAFKSYLLDTKQFSECRTIRNKFRVEFLNNYFGSNAQIQTLGEELILAGELLAARSINRSVKVMGKSLSLWQLESTLYSDLPFLKPRLDLAKVKAGQATIDQCCNMLINVFSIPCYEHTFSGNFTITFNGKRVKVKGEELGKWIVDNLGNRPEFKGL